MGANQSNSLEDPLVSICLWNLRKKEILEINNLPEDFDINCNEVSTIYQKKYADVQNTKNDILYKYRHIIGENTPVFRAKMMQKYINHLTHNKEELDKFLNEVQIITSLSQLSTIN